MGENITVFGELADKYDALVMYDDRMLDAYVEESGYSLRSMVLASVTTAFTHFSQGFTDVGRLGNGILIEGGVKGVAKDVLRTLNLVGSAGAAVGRGAKMLRLTQVGETCVWQATANALRLAGQRFLITAEELANQTGANWKAIVTAGRGAGDYDLIANWMQQAGMQLRILAQGSSLSVQQVLKLVRANPGGVVTFSLRFGQNGHRLYATWSRLGGLVIRDPNFLLKTYRSLADLEEMFGKALSVSASPIHFIPNSLLSTAASAAETAGGLGGLVLQLLPVLKVPTNDLETALQSIIVRDQSETIMSDAPQAQPSPGSTNSRQVAGPQEHFVRQGETLTNIAQTYYGSSSKWPVIWFANGRSIGKNPNLIQAGQKLRIPPLPGSAPILASGIERAKTWHV